MTKLTTLAFQPKLSGSGMQRRLGGYQAHHQTPKSQKKSHSPRFRRGTGSGPPFFRGGNPRFPPIQPETGIGVPGAGGRRAGDFVVWASAHPPCQLARTLRQLRRIGGLGCSPDQEIPGVPPAGQRFPVPAESGDGGFPDSRFRRSRESGIPSPFPGQIGNRGNGSSMGTSGSGRHPRSLAV
jgi:hypothetical protein